MFRISPLNSSLVLVIVLSLLPSQAAFAGDSAKMPNIIFILADDLGWADTTLYGHTRFYSTPNIQRLAERGMTFTRAYSASPLCSPTRSAILTGLSPARTGITTPNCHLPQVVLTATVPKTAAANQKAVMPSPVTRLKTEYRTLAETLKESGYATAHFGKWHLGSEPYSPLQQGFDIDMPHHPGPGPAGSYLAPWKFSNFKERMENEHIEDRMADEAVAWIEANKAGPFYLNYWMFSVHGPWGAKQALIEKYRRPPAVSVHYDDWKLIRIFHGGESGAHRPLLFNLREDLGEQHNVASQRPEIVKQLDGMIEQFLKQTQAVVPIPNPAFDPAKYNPELEGKANLKKADDNSKSKASKTKKAGAAEDDPALKGWKVRGSTAEVKNGILYVTRKSDEPFLGLAAGKIDQNAKLKFRIRCNGGQGKVVWLKNAANLADDSQGSSSYAPSPGEWTEITTDILAPKELPGIIRLYLPFQPEDVQVDWIELESGTQTRRWDF